MSKISALIGVEQRTEPCWRVGKYLGSMLTFDMGARHTKQGRRGPFEIGSSTIGVRQCFWWVEGAPGAFTSDDADADTAEELTTVFSGLTLTSCERRRHAFAFRFSRGVDLMLDLTNRYEAEADEFIASLSLKGGACFEMTPSGTWEFIPSEERPHRAEAA